MAIYRTLLCALLLGWAWPAAAQDSAEEVDESEGAVDLSHGELGAPALTSPFRSGFGDDVEWHGWPEALEASKKLDKPVFLLIHKSWCGACKSEWVGSVTPDRCTCRCNCSCMSFWISRSGEAAESG